MYVCMGSYSSEATYVGYMGFSQGKVAIVNRCLHNYPNTRLLERIVLNEMFLPITTICNEIEMA